MTVIVVANPKGGVGKSTLSTNLAGYLAAQGAWVA
ncbi:cobyrinic acid a,c-diamide synthase, partial [Burkholderia sp. TJI49]